MRDEAVTHIELQEMSAERLGSFAEVLEWRAQFQSDRIAYRFLSTDGTQDTTLTYLQVGRRVYERAVRLIQGGLVGQRALLLYPPGPEYVIAFLACLRSGVIAVPVYPPRANRSLERLRRVIVESAATTALGPETRVRADAPELDTLHWMIHQEDTVASSDSVNLPLPDPGQIAFLQYTSGSTAAPKGVAITHANLMIIRG